MSYISISSAFAFNGHSPDELFEICMGSNNAGDCELALDYLGGQGNQRDALAAAARACDLKSDVACRYMWRIAQDLGPGEEDQIFTKLIGLCETRVEVCDDLSTIYSEREMPDKALAASKKYYDKFGEGGYPYLLSQIKKDHGLLQEGTLKDCRKDMTVCKHSFYAIEHPQYAEILERIEQSCFDGNISVDSLSHPDYYSCEKMAEHFYLKKDYKRAYSYWSRVSKHSILSSLSIIGAKKYSSEVVAAAFNDFCTSSEKYLSSRIEALKADNCSAENILSKRTPAAVEEEALKTIQHLHNSLGYTPDESEIKSGIFFRSLVLKVQFSL